MNRFPPVPPSIVKLCVPAAVYVMSAGARPAGRSAATTSRTCAPIGAPPAVQEIINAGNQIARLQYLWGGGHGAFEDYAYDCSGSVSFVLAAAHLLNTTEVSGQFMSYGDPGPGHWVTIFANDGHVYMYVAGLRFDTVALAEYGSRWTNHTAGQGRRAPRRGRRGLPGLRGRG